MAAAVPITDNRRLGDRLEVERRAVLRMADKVEPIMLTDLTAGGCRFLSDARLPLSAAVSIGIAGVGHTPARIAWRNGSTYGCAFERALPADAVTPTAPDNVASIGSVSQTAVELGYDEIEYGKGGFGTVGFGEGGYGEGGEADVQGPLRTWVAVITGLVGWFAIIAVTKLAF